MQTNEPTPHVVIIGAGFAGLYATRALAQGKVRVTLVDRRNHHTFQPLLYQVATAALSPGEIAEALGRVLGHRVRYQDASPALFSKVARVLGFPDYVTAAVLTYFDDYRRGAFAIAVGQHMALHAADKLVKGHRRIVLESRVQSEDLQVIVMLGTGRGVRAHIGLGRAAHIGTVA